MWNLHGKQTCDSQETTGRDAQKVKLRAKLNLEPDFPDLFNTKGSFLPEHLPEDWDASSARDEAFDSDLLCEVLDKTGVLDSISTRLDLEWKSPCSNTVHISPRR